MNRRAFVRSAAITGATALSARNFTAFGMESPNPDATRVNINLDETAGPFPHVWEECAGSDRAVVGLRQQWLSDLERCKREIGLKSVRFHGLFDDEMGVWAAGTKPNFLYVDTVFDAMMERGVRPFVELSFMPGRLASGRNTAFFYRGNITPPTDMASWSELIRALGEHCVARYGLSEVSKWSFEVWNEPNLKFFWTGTQSDYFELYRHAVTALKSVNSGLRVGGPSSAQAGWVGDLLDFCAKENLPIDFASTHIYPDDPQKAVFGSDVNLTYEEVIPRALQKVKAQIEASKFPSVPLYITEWSSQNPAFIAHTVQGTRGLAQIMSYWTFDSVYEELGVPRSFMNNSFGLIGMRGVPRPSYHTFTLLHKLGEIQLKTGEGPLLATKRNDGSVAILVWNLVPQPPGKHTATGDPSLQTGVQYKEVGMSREFVLTFHGEHRRLKGQVTRVDDNSGSLRRAFEQIGSPAYPSVQQIEELKTRSELAVPDKVSLSASRELNLRIPPNGLALVELG
jgi:xylan 1,4-beta-xylosidase